MITLKQFKEWIKPQIDYGDSITIGKIDMTKEKAVCIYGNAGSGSPVLAIGGVGYSSYNKKSLKILTRWTKNADKAELHAQDIFNKLLDMSFFIAEKECFIEMTCAEPIPLDTDEKGVYEYVIEFNLFYER